LYFRAGACLGLSPCGNLDLMSTPPPESLRPSPAGTMICLGFTQTWWLLNLPFSTNCSIGSKPTLKLPPPAPNTSNFINCWESPNESSAQTQFLLGILVKTSLLIHPLSPAKLAREHKEQLSPAPVTGAMSKPATGGKER